jgi:hypothetical protein
VTATVGFVLIALLAADKSFAHFDNFDKLLGASTAAKVISL